MSIGLDFAEVVALVKDKGVRDGEAITPEAIQRAIAEVITHNNGRIYDQILNIVEKEVNKRFKDCNNTTAKFG